MNGYRTITGQVQDKTEKMDSNRRRPIDVRPVRYITGLLRVQNLLTDFANVKKHETVTLKLNSKVNGH